MNGTQIVQKIVEESIGGLAVELKAAIGALLSLHRESCEKMEQEIVMLKARVAALENAPAIGRKEFAEAMARLEVPGVTHDYPVVPTTKKVVK